MTNGMARFSLDSIFSDVKTGEYHASSKLNQGNVPLISCKTEDHGVEGFFDIPESKTYQRAVTIACDGTPLTSFYHPFRFAAKDNVLVCIPKKDVKLTTILYGVAYLNKERWRFSYGRKSYANKIGKLGILFPMTRDGKIDEKKIESMLADKNMNKFLPEQNDKQEREIGLRFGRILLCNIFDLESGDYHSTGMLQSGEIPLVSCGETDNGVVGYYSIPFGKMYENALTVAYNGSWPLLTKFHPYKFGAKDDVAVCIPKKPLKATTLIFLRYMISRQAWRYSYGRKCFRTKLENLSINIPVTAKGEIDENAIERIVSNTTYWGFLSKQIQQKIEF